MAKVGICGVSSKRGEHGQHALSERISTADRLPKAKAKTPQVSAAGGSHPFPWLEIQTIGGVDAKSSCTKL